MLLFNSSKKEKETTEIVPAFSRAELLAAKKQWERDEAHHLKYRVADKIKKTNTRLITFGYLAFSATAILTAWAVVDSFSHALPYFTEQFSFRWWNFWGEQIDYVRGLV